MPAPPSDGGNRVAVGNAGQPGVTPTSSGARRPGMTVPAEMRHGEPGSAAKSSFASRVSNARPAARPAD